MPVLLPVYKRDCLEIAVDESGRGSLIGEVTAGAVMIDPEIPIHNLLNDSKKMTAKNREIVKDWVYDNCVCGIGTASAQEIDSYNIQQATFMAMHRAIQSLGIEPDHLLIDGNRFKPYKVNGNLVQHTVVPQGDGKYANIAAASVIAKQHRDATVKRLVEEHPELDAKYGIGSNMGYGSAQHMKAIEKYGPSDFHRMSFAPCKNWHDRDNIFLPDED